MTYYNDKGDCACKGVNNKQPRPSENSIFFMLLNRAALRQKKLKCVPFDKY